MRPFTINNSHQYLGFLHFQLFSYAHTHLICSNITRTTINIFIFLYTYGTSIISSTRTTISIFIFICICKSSIIPITKTTTSIFIFIWTCGTSTITTNKTIISIFIIICIRNISTTTIIFIFICIRGTSTSTSTSTFATFLITKLAYIIPCFQKIRIIICLLALYLSLISSYGFVIKILRRLSMALLMDLMRRIKTISFVAMFNWSIINWFKVLYLDYKFNRQITLCVTKLQASSQLYCFATF